MSTPVDGRSRRRLVTRRGIAGAATRLFLEKGFDQVTVDEIAAVAGVGRMTVFNHFPRKEDIFFDRDEESRRILRDALRPSGGSSGPIEALRLLAHRLVAEESPFVEFTPASRAFMEAIEHSETLKARARAIRDELADIVAAALAEGAGCESADPVAHLAAALLGATWSAAFIQAYRTLQRGGSTAEARSVFLALIDRGTSGLTEALMGTRYL
jgi:AcrR family transcriptional regulator